MASDLPVWAAWLIAEVKTRQREEGPSPWCFDDFRDLLGIHVEDWPQAGLVATLAMHSQRCNFDIDKYSRLSAFIDEFVTQVEAAASDQTLLKLINTKSGKNMHADGVLLCKQLFKKLFWPKASRSKIDLFLREQELLSWQRSAKLKEPWYRMRKVCLRQLNR